MANNTDGRWLTVGALALFVLACVAALGVRLLYCSSEYPSFDERDELTDPSAKGTPHHGAFVPESVSGDERLVLYSYRFNCLQLERWRRSAQSKWNRDEHEGAKRIWIKFGRDLQLVEQWTCSAQAKGLPRPRAISPRGTRLAWIWQSTEDDANGEYFLQVAIIRDLHLPSFRPKTAVASNPVPVQPPYHELTFIDEERLLLWYGQDRVLTWDSKNEFEIARDPLVEGASAFEGRDELVASANFTKGVLGLTSLGSGEVRDRPVLQLIQSDRPEGTGRKGSALALGPRSLAALASNQGTFAVLELERGDAEIVLSDIPLPGFNAPITQVKWLDHRNIAFAGDVAALYVANLESTYGGERVRIVQVHSLPLQEVPNGMQWIRYDPAKRLLLYGTNDGVFVGKVLFHCQRIGWGMLSTILVGTAGVLSLLWALLFTLRELRARRQSPRGN